MIALRGILLLLLIVLTACAEVDPCALSLVAKVPMESLHRLLFVPVGINGQWATLLVDSGAERTILSEQAVARLGLRHDPRLISRSLGVGGMYVNADVTIDHLVLGGTRMGVDHMAVGRLNLDIDGEAIADGLLGADILLTFDLDIDVPGKTLSLYRARRCQEAVPPWDGPAVEITGVTTRKTRMLLPFQLDGTAGMGILDTGASATTIGIAMAERMGLTNDILVKDPSIQHHGAGPNVAEGRLHRFQELRVGPAVIPRPRLSVMPGNTGIDDGLIGADFLQGRRVWMAFQARRLFVSPLARETPFLP